MHVFLYAYRQSQCLCCFSVLLVTPANQLINTNKKWQQHQQTMSKNIDIMFQLISLALIIAILVKFALYLFRFIKSFFPQLNRHDKDEYGLLARRDTLFFFPSSNSIFKNLYKTFFM